MPLLTKQEVLNEVQKLKLDAHIEDAVMFIIQLTRQKDMEALKEEIEELRLRALKHPMMTKVKGSIESMDNLNYGFDQALLSSQDIINQSIEQLK